MLDLSQTDTAVLVAVARVVDLAVKIFCGRQLGWVMGEGIAVSYFGERAVDESLYERLWARLRNSVVAWIVDGGAALAVAAACASPLPGGAWG